jgi:hypothetical protein
VKVRTLLWDKRPKYHLPPYQTAVINLDNGDEVQVTESPTGRSVQVHVLDRHGWRKVYPILPQSAADNQKPTRSTQKP